MYSPDYSARSLLKIAAILLFLFLFPVRDSLAGQLQLAWNPSDDPTVTGYKVYHGTQSRAYTDITDVQGSLTKMLPGMAENQTHYFAVTAYSADGESDFSDELICYGLQVIASPNGQIIPGDSMLLAEGSSQTLSIVPDSGFVIQDVLVDEASVGPVTQYTFDKVSSSHTISAVFTANVYTVTASCQGSGSISPSGSVSVSSGQNQTYSITPAINNRISNVLVDGLSVGAVSTYTFSRVSTNHTITAVFAPTKISISSSVQGNGSISPSGTIGVVVGKSQAYKISPASNSKIIDVLVDGLSVGATSTFSFSNVTSDHTIVAVFASTYKVKASVKGSGSISPAGTMSAASGQSLTYAITPANFNKIADVAVDGTSVGAVSNYTFSNLAANHTIKATFAPITHTISASAQGSGSISPAGSVSVTAGKSKTYKISAASKQKIADVVVDGLSVGAVSRYSFSLVADDHNIVATFTPVTYSLSASAQGSGTISPSGAVSLAYGSSQTYTITPATNNKVSDVKVDGKSVGAVSTYSFSGLKANHSIVATFAPITYTVSASVQGNGTISPLASASLGVGSSMAYTITPSANNKIADVKVDGTSIGAASSYEFKNITANHSITAIFVPITYTISTAVQGSGTISPSGSVTVTSGSSKAFKITPASGNKISSILIDGLPAQVSTDFTFNSISGNHTIQANFAALNPPPVAEAGPNQIVKGGATVSLNGSNSTTPVSTIASYKWSQVGGTSVTISNPAAQICSFTAPTVSSGAALTFRLDVLTKAGLSANDTCIVNVSGTDLPPSVIAGPDQTVPAYTIVTLDGSATVSDDSAASYQWVQTSGPAVEISYANAARATFVAPDLGFEGCTLTFKLTVTNSSGLKMTDQCLVNVIEANIPPLASAGSDQTVYGDDMVVLDGSGSIDQSGGIVSYRWTQLSGIPVSLSDPTAPSPTFTAPDMNSASTGLLFMLTVTDAGGLSSSDKCLVTVPPSQLSLSAQTK
jgi:hypothetical protein